MKRLAALVTLALTACSTSDALTREPAPEVAARDADLQQQDAQRRDFQAVLVRLDQAMDSYVRALANQGEARADSMAEKLEKLIRETVLDLDSTSPDGKKRKTPLGENFLRLQALAADGTYPDQQAIALAALGFSDRPEVMPLLVQGAMLDDPFRIDRAVLGLAMLRAPATPPGVLAAIVERPTHPEDGRVQAAWALYRIQSAAADMQPFVAIWLRYLTQEKDRLPAGVVMTALRGMGLVRTDEHAKVVAPFLSHNTPRVRMAAALALGRMNAQAHWQDLLALLGPQETVQNVRLHARIALAALAGNQDYGYDVAAWRKVFDRGGR
jgi:hypothetical protein